MILCRSMKTAAVQQGVVHNDPDVDAIYRLEHADQKTGLHASFNKMAPVITFEEGTYSPWNSQNTLFHYRAFFTMLLPTTVAFRGSFDYDYRFEAFNPNNLGYHPVKMRMLNVDKSQRAAFCRNIIKTFVNNIFKKEHSSTTTTTTGLPNSSSGLVSFDWSLQNSTRTRARVKRLYQRRQQRPHESCQLGRQNELTGSIIRFVDNMP